MARRRSSKKKGASFSPMLLIGAGVVAAAACIIVFSVFRSKDKPQAGSDIPLDILMTTASQLTKNSYVLDGTVIDRFSRGESELISFLYKDGSGRECIIPISVPAEARNDLNIDRNEQYRIAFSVKDLSRNVKGVCVATSVLPK